MKFHSIATAPKDGRFILLAGESESTVYLTLHPDQVTIPHRLREESMFELESRISRRNRDTAAMLLSEWMDLIEKRIAALEVEVHENELGSNPPEEES